MDRSAAWALACITADNEPWSADYLDRWKRNYARGVQFLAASGLLANGYGLQMHIRCRQPIQPISAATHQPNTVEYSVRRAPSVLRVNGR